MLPGELKPGAVIAQRYRIDRLLGRGGMGAVFSATHTALGKKVAIKVLNLTIENDLDGVERFKREGRATAAIGHTGVVEVLDTGTTEAGMPFLVMELLEGPTLRELFLKTGALPPAVATAIIAPMLDALAAAHEKGILHRDLKPGNVVLATAPRREVKLLDFGVSKIIGSVTVVTRTGIALGTPRYMSPEQMQGARELTPASDLYAVGALLYELVSGTQPFPGGSELERMEKVVTTDAPNLATVAPKAPPALCQLVDKLLKREPAQRPPSAKEARRELLAAVTPDTDGLWAAVERMGGGLEIEPVTTPGALSPSNPSLIGVQDTEPGGVALTTRRLKAKAGGGRQLWVGVGVAAALVTLGVLAGVVSGPPPSAEPAAPPPVEQPPLARAPASPPAAPAPPAPAVAAPPPPTATRDVIVERVSAPPEVLEQQAEAERNKKLVAEASAALRAGDLAQVETLLEGCKVDDKACPEAAALLEQARLEKTNVQLLDRAERALAVKDTDEATRLLGESYTTQVFLDRHHALEEKLKEQLVAKMNALKGGRPRPPRANNEVTR